MLCSVCMESRKEGKSALALVLYFGGQIVLTRCAVTLFEYQGWPRLARLATVLTKTLSVHSCYFYF